MCHWSNMPTTSHIHVPLHYYSTLYIGPTLLHMTVNKTTTFNYHAIAIYMPITNMLLKCYIYASYLMCAWENHVSINTTYEFTAINSVARSTGIHTFPIIGICPWTNMPPNCMSVALLCYCSLHVDPSLFHIQVKMYVCIYIYNIKVKSKTNIKVITLFYPNVITLLHYISLTWLIMLHYSHIFILYNVLMFHVVMPCMKSVK